MISGIHLATALSVMLHMEQEGNEMETTKELIDALRVHGKIDAPLQDGPAVRGWNRMVQNSLEAADRLSEQQQMIEELVRALEDITYLDGDTYRIGVHGDADVTEEVGLALSRAKDHTKDAE